MSGRRQFLVGLLALTGFAAQAAGPGQNSSRAVVIFIDDLHLAFPSTPSLRKGLVSAIDQALMAGRVLSIVSDGPSSISQPLTADRELLLRSVNRSSGSGMPRNATGASPAEQEESRKRETVAKETLDDVISSFQSPRARPQVRLDGVLYVTERALKLPALVPVIVTRPEGMDAAMATLLSR